MFFSHLTVLSNTPPKCSFTNASESDNDCNSCLCTDNGIAQCSNLWCGLSNCVADSNYTTINTNDCNDNEVCVPALKETCLSPPCPKRGDCRVLEQRTLRTAPPKYPTFDNCWPNQADLNEDCSRVTILLDLIKLTKGSSTEGFCHKLRTLLGGRMLEEKHFFQSLIIIICDIKSGTNDTIEVTIVSRRRQSCQLIVLLLISLISLT